MNTHEDMERDIVAGLPNAPKPFNASRESQDDYCAACVHADACNVMLKDGEECGDRCVWDADRITAHWPGIEAIEVTDDLLWQRFQERVAQNSTPDQD